MKPVIAFGAAAVLAFATGYGAGRFQMWREVMPPAAPQIAEATDGPFYVEAGQLVVPVWLDGRTQAFILTQITLEAAGTEEANLLRRRLPQARSALLQSLYGLAGSGFFDGPTVVPAEAARALQDGANAQLGQPLVKAVLIDRLLRQDNTRL